MTPSPNPNNQVNGAEDDFAAFVRNTVAEEVAKGQAAQNPNGGPPPAASIPLTINGQTFNFNTPEELNLAVNGMVANYNNQLAQVQAQTQAPAKPANQVTGNDEPGFDMTLYVDKLTKDPLAAANYVDEYRFGVKNPTEVIKEAIAAKEKLQEISQTLSVYQFKDNHPEFVGSPQAANVIDQVRQAHGLGFDLPGLEAAYAISVQRGFIPDPRQHQAQSQTPPYQQAPPMFSQNPYGSQGQQFQQAPQGQYFPPQAPPPSVPRGGYDVPANLAQLAEGMSTDQIEAVFARFQ